MGVGDRTPDSYKLLPFHVGFAELENTEDISYVGTICDPNS